MLCLFTHINKHLFNCECLWTILNAICFVFANHLLRYEKMGRNPGFVVMRWDSCSKGHEFEFRHHILDGHFFTNVFVVKFVICVWKDENKLKKGPDFYKKDMNNGHKLLGSRSLKLHLWTINQLPLFPMLLWL